MIKYSGRDVAQLVSARVWGTRGRRGGAGHPDTTLQPVGKTGKIII